MVSFMEAKATTEENCTAVATTVAISPFTYSFISWLTLFILQITWERTKRPKYNSSGL